MVGRALQRVIERHLQITLARRGDKAIEILDRAQLWVDGVVTTLLVADRPGTSHVVRRRIERVVLSLPERSTGRVNGRKVNDVEAELLDARRSRYREAAHRVDAGRPLGEVVAEVRRLWAA